MDIFKEYQEAGYEPDEMCFNTVICAFARCVPAPMDTPNTKSAPQPEFPRAHCMCGHGHNAESETTAGLGSGGGRWR